jgi:hypothetical protein
MNMVIDYTPDGMQRVAEDLMGTCKCLDEALIAEFGDAAEEDVPIQMRELLDEVVRECATCGWWVEASEVDDGGDCEDCQGSASDE